MQCSAVALARSGFLKGSEVSTDSFPAKRDKSGPVGPELLTSCCCGGGIEGGKKMSEVPEEHGLIWSGWDAFALDFARDAGVNEDSDAPVKKVFQASVMCVFFYSLPVSKQKPST